MIRETLVVPTFLTCLVAVGCTSTSYVTLSGTGDSLSFNEFNRETAGRKGVVTLAQDVDVRATNIRLSPDSCVWLDAASGKVRQSRPEEVRRILVSDMPRGMWEGVGIGALAGIPIVTLLVASSAEDRTERGLAYMAGLIGGAFLGGVVGAVAGGIVGHDDVYIISPYAGGMDAVYLKGGSRVIGTIIEYVPGKHVILEAWDGIRHVIDHELVERVER
jgi:hypothetical protein